MTALVFLLAPYVLLGQHDTLTTVEGTKYIGRIVEIRRDRDVSMILLNRDAIVVEWSKIARIGRSTNVPSAEERQPLYGEITPRPGFADLNPPRFYFGGFAGLCGQLTFGTIGNTTTPQATYLVTITPEVGYRLSRDVYLSGTIGVQSGSSALATESGPFDSPDSYSGSASGWFVGLGSTIETRGMLVSAHLVYREIVYKYTNTIFPDDVLNLRHSGYGVISRVSYAVAPFLSLTAFSGVSIFTGQPNASAYSFEFGGGVSFSNITSLLHKSTR